MNRYEKKLCFGAGLFCLLLSIMWTFYWVVDFFLLLINSNVTWLDLVYIPIILAGVLSARNGFFYYRVRSCVNLAKFLSVFVYIVSSFFSSCINRVCFQLFGLDCFPLIFAILYLIFLSCLTLSFRKHCDVGRVFFHNLIFLIIMI